jgi:hypothetical protein
MRDGPAGHAADVRRDGAHRVTGREAFDLACCLDAAEAVVVGLFPGMEGAIIFFTVIVLQDQYIPFSVVEPAVWY